VGPGTLTKKTNETNAGHSAINHWHQLVTASDSFLSTSHQRNPCHRQSAHYRLNYSAAKLCQVHISTMASRQIAHTNSVSVN